MQTNPTISNVLSTVTTPKGPLALLVKPPAAAPTGTIHSSAYHLHYFACNPTAPCLSRIHSSKIQQHPQRRKRRRQSEGNQQQEQLGQQEQVESLHEEYYQSQKTYHPCKEAFTLLFFCEMNCRNSQRFTMVLSSFLQTVQSMDNFKNGKRPIQLICIPNDDLDLSFLLNHMTHGDYNMDEEEHKSSSEISWTTKKGGANIFTHLMSCCDFWHMGYDHTNRLAMIRMLSVSIVPTLIVIDNDSGRVVTTRGMEAIEYACSNGDLEQQQQQRCKTLLEQWEQGRNGIPWMYTCVVS